MMFLFLSNQHMLRACVPALFSAISVEKLRWKLAIIGLLFGADHFSFVSMVFCPESEIGTTNSQQWICEITMHQARLSVHFIRPKIGVGITDRQGKHALTNQKLLYIWTAARCKFHFSMSLWLVLSLIFYRLKNSKLMSRLFGFHWNTGNWKGWLSWQRVAEDYTKPVL